MIADDAQSERRRVTIVRALRKELTEMGATTDMLDELVQDCASEQASEVNNSGLPAQLDYLLKAGWTAEDILGRVKMAQEEELGRP